jgi:hypothetical protein
VSRFPTQCPQSSPAPSFCWRTGSGGAGTSSSGEVVAFVPGSMVLFSVPLWELVTA